MKRFLVLLAVLFAIGIGNLSATQDTTKAASMPMKENKSEMSTPRAHAKKVAQRAKRHHKSKKVEEKKEDGTSK